MRARVNLLSSSFLVSAALLTGCSHEVVAPAPGVTVAGAAPVTVIATPAPQYAAAAPANVVAVPSKAIRADAIPGRFAYRIDGPSLTRMNAADPVQGFTCSLDTITVNGDSSLRAAIDQALPPLFEHIEHLPAGLTPTELRNLGYEGMVTIAVDEFRPAVRFQQRALSNPDAEARADLTLSARVEGPGGLIWTSRAAGWQSQNVPAGGCAGGARALGESTGEAIRVTVNRLVEQIAASPQVRVAGNRLPSVAATQPSVVVLPPPGRPHDITGNGFETR